MNRLGYSLIYRADWMWQRTGEAFLVVRFYWWCAQVTIVVIVPMAWKGQGISGVIYLVSPAYVYDERHGWTDSGVSATDLIFMMRQEREERLRVSPLDRHILLHGEHRYVTPLLDRPAVTPWAGPPARGVASVPDAFVAALGETEGVLEAVPMPAPLPDHTCDEECGCDDPSATAVNMFGQGQSPNSYMFVTPGLTDMQRRIVMRMAA